MKAIRTGLVALVATAVSTLAMADVAYTFDADTQGFTLVGDGTLAHVAGGGNGHLSVTDTNGNTDVYLQMPLPAAVNDWSAYLGGTLSFDGVMLNGSTPSWPDFGIVRFTSATDQVAFADLAPNAGSVITEPGLAWKTYTATLDAATFNQGTASLASVLANLKSVSFSMEAGNGPVEVVGVDNVRLTTAVPEPETWALMLASLGLLGLRGLQGLRRKA